MSIQGNDNADWGRTVETAACDRWDLEHVARDDDGDHWFDAIASTEVTASMSGTIVDAGTPVEVKGCAVRVSDGSASRRGRWWFRRDSHERLLQDAGEYALGVYDSDSADVLRIALTDAQTVDALLSDRWTSCGRDHRADQSAQLRWSAVFDDVAGDRS